VVLNAISSEAKMIFALT